MTSPNDLVSEISYSNVSMCALVLEDNPRGQDSRLDFESFPPDGIEESYAVTGYREIAADRMPQPGFAAYRGGNWSAFNLELKFRANNTLNRGRLITTLSQADLDSILTEMERKARWCQALAFPLERKIGEAYAARVIGRVGTEGGPSESDLRAVGLGQLTRHDPPMVLIQFGSWMTLRGYITGYSLKWEHPFHPSTVQPYGCTVTLSFQRLDFEYPRWETIRNQAGTSPHAPFQRIDGTVLVGAGG